MANFCHGWQIWQIFAMAGKYGKFLPYLPAIATSEVAKSLRANVRLSLTLLKEQKAFGLRVRICVSYPKSLRSLRILGPG